MEGNLQIPIRVLHCGHPEAILTTSQAEVIFNAEAITRRYLNLHLVPSTESQKLTEEFESLFRDAESPIQVSELGVG